MGQKRGYKQTEDHKRRRVLSRRNNGKSWNSEVSKKKMSISATGRKSHRKGMLWEEEYGIEKSKEMKKFKKELWRI